MKILQVTTHFNMGGIGNYILTLSKALKDKGAEIAVATSGGDLEEILAGSAIPHRRLDMRTKFEFGPKAIKSAFAIAGIVRDEGINIIHAHSRVSQVACAIASRMTGVPYVTTCHGYFKKRSRGIFDTWGARVIAISDAVRTHLEEDLGVDRSRIALVYSGVDTKRFVKEYSAGEALSIKKELGLKDTPIVGTIGRLSSVKGQEYLIRALKKVISKKPDVQGLVVGSGEEEVTLKNLARSLGIEGAVRFVPSCPDTHRFLSIMDVFVFPSVKEGLGIALLEALASGRACVASRIGGIADIIKDGYNGILVDVGDSASIADAVVRLLDDELLRKNMGERGRAIVMERFTLDLMAKNIIQLYEKVVR